MPLDQRLPILHELGFRNEAVSALREYIAHLRMQNDELNLISRKMTDSELIDNHVIDCLIPIRHFPANIKTVADFGSGGGLPSILYALQFPAVKFQLFEKSPKKQAFLETCRKFAPNIEVVGSIPPRLNGIDLVTARAFKPIDVILEMSRSYFEGGGRYFLLKGRAEKIDEELIEARRKFKTLKCSVVPLKSPVIDNERNLVLIP